MKTKPIVGDVVALNDHGYDFLHLRTRAAVLQSLRMTITDVSESSLTEPEETWVIEVDQPLINQFLLDHHMVDLVTLAGTPMASSFQPSPVLPNKPYGPSGLAVKANPIQEAIKNTATASPMSDYDSW